MAWLIGFGVLVGVVFLAGAAKGGLQGGGAAVLFLIFGLIALFGILAVFD
ncbi:hypothetical protein [Allochromatium palmeri]|uniref:Uncharacterized protein n=1 Tax=Allochromatium palmeri TaxID=231048 RepID=A0A6N8EK71_9GAMM|nr:hypothetical protein [Allochromatium palmeri]MTW22734.1 hypothetical protein [Allochromatium palmeri]